MWNHAIHTKAASQVNRFGLRHPRGLGDGERSALPPISRRSKGLGMKNFVICIAVLTVLATAALMIESNQDASAQDLASDAKENPFAGKAVIITATPGVAAAPMQDIRIERLGGREYLVYLAETDNGETYEYWRAMDEISREKEIR